MRFPPLRGPGCSQTTPEAALSEEWLARTDETLAFYRKLRDEFEPGKPFWLTETADAACGGNPWAYTFLDSSATSTSSAVSPGRTSRVVMHNTLVASDYGLLDDKTLEPKPNYWAALLWRRLMGTTVLDSGVPIQEGLHVYAHCLRGTPGGVALLVINNSRGEVSRIALPAAAERYTLTAQTLKDKRVALNGEKLKLGSGDELPELRGAHAMPGPSNSRGQQSHSSRSPEPVTEPASSERGLLGSLASFV